MSKTKQKYAFHVDCVECDKHYCFKKQTDQILIAFVHQNENHTIISSLNPNECEDICGVENA